MKRAFDLLLTPIFLIMVLPLVLIVIVGVILLMDRPVFFVQRRPGLSGKPFMLIKFRTMHNWRTADGMLMSDAQRLSKFGEFLRRTSLDELPELWNVLKGDMSLVGPRPLLMEYLPLYTSEQARRHEVRPGITGWAQVNGRNALSWDDKFKLDIWYVDNQSFWLDLKILLLTGVKVIQRQGIRGAGEATMAKFTGVAAGRTEEK